LHEGVNDRKSRIAEVGEGVTAFLNGDGSMGLANAVAIVDGRTATVVDAMLLPRMVGAVRDEIARRGARPELVLNTHHHADHVGGNVAFSGVRVAGHPVTAAIVRQMATRVHELGRIMPPFAGELASMELRPPEPTALTEDLPLGARLLAFTPAHTPADLAVWFPRPRLLLAGDLCFNRVVPLAVHGLLSGWIAALDEVIALEPVTIVPGHGPVATLEDVRGLRAYLASVLAAAREVAAGRAPLEEAATLVDTGPIEGWVDPERTQLNLRRALQEAQGEIDAGHLGPPVG
jgi:glyoxylase-like metal-dependent hydrolase (beta-lactamase superfamily II)